MNNEDSGIYVAIVDDADDDIVYVGGFIGSQPLLAKYEAKNMRFAWNQGLQVASSTAVAAWNLAVQSSHDMLAALVETDSGETLLFLLEKTNGAPVMPSHAISLPNAPSVNQITPFKRQMMHWEDASPLWIQTGHEAGQSLAIQKAPLMKLTIDRDAGSV